MVAVASPTYETNARLELGRLALRELQRKRELKAAAEASLYQFMRQAWPIIEPATTFIPGWHLEAICLHLEAISKGWIRNLLINVPPRHAKSITVSVMWPCWEWARRPHLRWLFSSYAESLSIRDSVKCRRLMQSRWYQQNWGHKFSLMGDQNAKERYDNNQGGYRLATSVNGRNTGEGGDIIVVDDAHNTKDRESDVMREGVLTWWDEVMPTRINNPKTGSKVVIGQRVHERDISGHILERGGWEHLCLAAEWEG